MGCKKNLNGFCIQFNRSDPPKPYCNNKCTHKEEDNTPCERHTFDDNWCLQAGGHSDYTWRSRVACGGDCSWIK